ncbi:hypothetical protein PR048_003711 [Dryococelus australis]|uniref:Uncharacterized protein n=1 Tax=Dryococelus australis TaxID=614101 RepID=A0ABQ9INR9_9NEOP|nr:hypothetical protein PR048_003711 [Dryococelus australis]
MSQLHDVLPQLLQLLSWSMNASLQLDVANMPRVQVSLESNARPLLYQLKVPDQPTSISSITVSRLCDCWEWSSYPCDYCRQDSAPNIMVSNGMSNSPNTITIRCHSRRKLSMLGPQHCCEVVRMLLLRPAILSGEDLKLVFVFPLRCLIIAESRFNCDLLRKVVLTLILLARVGRSKRLTWQPVFEVVRDGQWKKLHTQNDVTMFAQTITSGKPSVLDYRSPVLDTFLQDTPPSYRITTLSSFVLFARAGRSKGSQIDQLHTSGSTSPVASNDSAAVIGDTRGLGHASESTGVRILTSVFPLLPGVASVNASGEWAASGRPGVTSRQADLAGGQAGTAGRAAMKTPGGLHPVSRWPTCPTIPFSPLQSTTGCSAPIPLVRGLSRGSPVSHASSFRRYSILTSRNTRWLSRTRC